MNLRDRFPAAQTQASGAAESPCVRRCAIDDQGLCVGCARNRDEIARWAQMTAAARQHILRQLPGRRQRAV